MNFNICIDEQIVRKLDTMAKSLKRSRNSIIREAIEEWLKKEEAAPDFPDGKDFREGLKERDEDPLA